MHRPQGCSSITCSMYSATPMMDVQAMKIMKLRFREPGILSNKDIAIVKLTAC